LSFLVARKKAGLTQAAAAEKLGIAAASVSQWETGKTLPETERLRDIAKLYNCTVDELLEPDASTS
jgi:transcriptional regulator with XRE-family HTH domain